MGRKSKLTVEVVDKICQAVKLGASLSLAARYAGICDTSLHRYLALGAEGGRGERAKMAAKLVARLRQAEGDGGVGLLAKIQKSATNGDWRAGAWILERRYPEDYGRRVDNRHGGIDGAPPISVQQGVIILPGDASSEDAWAEGVAAYQSSKIAEAAAAAGGGGGGGGDDDEV